MIMKPFPILLVLVTGMSSCKDAGTSPSPDEVLDQIRIVVFRHQMLTEYPATEPSEAHFLGIYLIDSVGHYYDDPVDPSDRVMNAFQTNSPPIQRVSECTIILEGVFDEKSGKHGVLYSIGPIRQIQPEKYEVEGGWYVSGNGIEWYRYTVVGVPYHWKVVNATRMGMA